MLLLCWQDLYSNIVRHEFIWFTVSYLYRSTHILFLNIYFAFQAFIYINGNLECTQKLNYIVQNIGGATTHLTQTNGVHAVIGTLPMYRSPSRLVSILIIFIFYIKFINLQIFCLSENASMCDLTFICKIYIIFPICILELKKLKEKKHFEFLIDTYIKSKKCTFKTI